MVSTNSLKNTSPLLSVIMPAYNAEKYIAEAIESILAQTFKRFELIIVDDCSTDDTWKIIQQYQKRDVRIIALRNKVNLKLSKTLNIAISKSRCHYVARMDADDWSYPHRFKVQYAYMEKFPQVGILGGNMEIINEVGNLIGKRSYEKTDAQIRKRIFWFSPFSHPLIMIRKSVLDKVGYYDSSFNPAEDYELYFRIGEVAKFANLPDVLLKYRIIKKSMTTGSTKKMELQTIRIRKIYSNSKTYPTKTIHKIYNGLHWVSVYIIPSQFKIRLFNYFRNKNT